MCTTYDASESSDVFASSVSFASYSSAELGEPSESSAIREPVDVLNIPASEPSESSESSLSVELEESDSSGKCPPSDSSDPSVSPPVLQELSKLHRTRSYRLCYCQHFNQSYAASTHTHTRARARAHTHTVANQPLHLLRCPKSWNQSRHESPRPDPQVVLGTCSIARVLRGLRCRWFLSSRCTKNALAVASLLVFRIWGGSFALYPMQVT